MSKSLYLLRHAKAEPWGPGIDDFVRPLAVKGRRHMEALASWCKRFLETPGVVVCSPSVRTTQTLAPLLSLWPQLKSHCLYPKSLYGASAGTLMRMAEQGLEDCDSLLMVGHNPGFEDLAFSLMPEQQRSDYRNMSTGTLAVFDFANWPDPSNSDVELRHWITRQDLSVT